MENGDHGNPSPNQALKRSIDRLHSTIRNQASTHILFEVSLKEICSLHSAELGFVVLQSTIDKKEWSIVSTYSVKVSNSEETTKPTASRLEEPPTNHTIRRRSPRNRTPTRPASKHVKLPLLMQKDTELFLRAKGNRAAETASSKELKKMTEHIALPLGWPMAEQLDVIPIFDSIEVYGHLCLFNRPMPFDPSILENSWPLLTTIACLFRLLTRPSKLDHLTPPVTQPLSNEQYYQEMFCQLESKCTLALIELNGDLKITRFNPAAEQLFLLSSNTSKGMAITELIPERFPNEHKIHTFGFPPNTTSSPQQQRFLGQTLTGTPLPLNIQLLAYQYNKQQYHLLMITDCSEIDQIKQQHETEVQRFKAVADLAPVGILQANADWEVVYVNDRWFNICQLEKHDIEGRDWMTLFYHKDVKGVLEALRLAMVDKREYQSQCRLQAPSGNLIWVEFYARPFLNTSGKVDGFISTIIDYTYRHQIEQQLRHLAERDTLTGLANRALLKERLDHALCRGPKKGTLALLSVDLDGFKTVNDNFGHDIGDQLLVLVAERLNHAVREGDTVARIGGDEFVILLAEIENAYIATKLSEKLLRRLSEPFQIKRQEVFISASIGIAFAVGNHDVVDTESVLKQVDIALYRAKEMGRNNYQYYSAELETAAKERLFLGNSLHRALERSEFQIFYQLQADLVSGEIVGSEALLRWLHPERGLLEPHQFIGLLEETSLIVPVSRWLMDEAFQQHKSWIDDEIIPSKSHISINLSPKLLHDKNIANHFQEALERSDLSGKQVVLEITESALLDTSSTTAQLLSYFKSLGASLALDDFGTGYSSLSYLKKFPINCIKIDRSFVRDLLSDSEDAAITEAIITLAKSLNLNVIAEGVDDPKKIPLLRKWGCNIYQGYVLSQPLPGDKTTDHLKQFHPLPA